MKILMIVNDTPYGSEKIYNALRLAMKLQQEQAGTEIRIFLMADAVTAALPGQTTPPKAFTTSNVYSRPLSAKVANSKPAVPAPRAAGWRS